MGRVEQHLREALQLALAGQRAEVPEAGRLVWGWFGDLCRTRTSNGYGPNPISFAEIEAYSRLYRWPLEPRHVDMILALDRVWLETARTAGKFGGAPTPAPGYDSTPEAFDAVFG